MGHRSFVHLIWITIVVNFELISVNCSEINVRLEAEDATISPTAKSENTLGERRLVSRDPKLIRFYSFPDVTQPQVFNEIKLGSAATLASSGLVAGSKITIHSHGLYGSFNSNYSSCQPIKNAYLSIGYKNIICVDWSKLATPTLPPALGQLQYVEVVQNVGTVGKKVDSLIKFLTQNEYIDGPEMVHLTGHSLGSHVSGAAGKAVFKATGKKVHRISALDAAGPIYYPFKPKLNKSDATFVDCLHTDIELFGSAEPLGHADFFANFGIGQKQPGCQNQTIFDIIDSMKGRCSHRNAYKYYARTIRGERLIGCKCFINRLELFTLQCSIMLRTKAADELYFMESLDQKRMNA